jgi:uracil-DNA glycosylase
MNKVHPDWLPFFDESKKDLDEIFSKINYDSETIFPKRKYIFRALFYNSPQDIKLVLLGQDPYINSEIIDKKKIPQACGLSFSVPKTHKKIPPSLQNIFKEIKNCYPGYIIPKDGSLIRWVKEENILLLNSALTVIEGKSNSHSLLWSDFTNKLIKFVSDKNEKTIFLLMGSFAINKSSLIDITKHKIFTCKHPSPLSAYKGFFGSNIFKKINDYLIENNIEIINW